MLKLCPKVHTRTCKLYTEIQVNNKKLMRISSQLCTSRNRRIHTLLLNSSPSWEEFWISATKLKLYLLIEEAHPQSYFHKKTVQRLEYTSVLAGKSAPCTAAAASYPEGRIRFAGSTRSLHTAYRERQHVTDGYRTSF